MEKYMIMNLILLLLVILDAVGDGFRVRGWQKIHHSVESLQVAIWLSLLPAIHFEWLDFQWYYFAMYILGRMVFFDPVINLIMKQKLSYISKSSWDGWFYYFISGDGNPNRKRQWSVANTAFIFKFIALVWWVAWFISDGNAKAIFI